MQKEDDTSEIISYNKTLPDSSKKLKAWVFQFFLYLLFIFVLLTMTWKVFFLLIGFKDLGCTYEIQWIILTHLESSKENRGFLFFFLSRFTTTKPGHDIQKPTIYRVKSKKIPWKEFYHQPSF